MKTLSIFFTNQATLVRRSTALILPPHLVFPVVTVSSPLAGTAGTAGSADEAVVVVVVEASPSSFSSSLVTCGQVHKHFDEHTIMSYQNELDCLTNGEVSFVNITLDGTMYPG